MTFVDYCVHRLEAWNERKEQQLSLTSSGSVVDDVESNEVTSESVKLDTINACACSTRASTIDKWVHRAEEEVKEIDTISDKDEEKSKFCPLGEGER